MRDVAEAAGVSITTVSRVLSGTRAVDPELVERVRASQRSLGYRPNLLASGLRRQRTDTVGMVVPQVANPYFSALMQAVGRRLQAVGKTVMLVDAENSSDVEAEGLRRLVDRSVDGVFAIPVDERRSSAALTEAARSTRLIQVDRAAIGVDADLVDVDDVAGMDAVLAHLAGLGRRRVGFVSAERRDSTGRQRAEGFLAACEVYDLEATVTLLGDYSVEWGRQAAGTLLASRLPEAVVCGNDLIALGLLAVLRDTEVVVPDDVAITGYDDIGFATVTSPALTTVHQPLDEVAEAAVERLQAPTDGLTEPSVCRLTPTLVVRGSTDATAASPHVRTRWEVRR